MKKDTILIQFDDDKKILKIKNNEYNYKEIKNVKTFNKMKERIVNNEIKASILDMFTVNNYVYDFSPYTQIEENICLEMGIELLIGKVYIKVNLLENEKEETLLNTTKYYSYTNLVNFYIKKINKIIKENST